MITIPYPGGQGAGPIAVEEAEALLGSLMALGTDHGSVLQLDQLLQAVACPCYAGAASPAVTSLHGKPFHANSDGDITTIFRYFQATSQLHHQRILI